MLLFSIYSNLVCLLLPALVSSRVATPEDPVNLAAHHLKRLSSPLKNLLHRRDTILFAGAPDPSTGLALNSTNGAVVETIPFEQEIDIPTQGHVVYFLVKGEIDEDYSVRVEFWVHYGLDRGIGVFHGGLFQGVDMQIPASIKIVEGEARLYVVESGAFDILVFESYGSVHIPSGPSKVFPHFVKPIKRWKAGVLNSIQDVPKNSGVQTLSNDAGVDPSLSVA